MITPLPGPVKAALIDMDGTLYDSMPRHARAWHRMVTELGIKASVDEFFRYEGMTGAATIRQIFRERLGRDATPEECDKYYALKARYFAEQPDVVVMPGARQMVEELLSRGIVCVLVTGSAQNSLLSRLDSDFPGVFRLRVTARDVSRGKPDPEPFLRAMQLAGVAPSESIAIDNAPLGVMSAARSGAFTIGVVTGPIPRAELVEAGANVVFDSMPLLAKNLPSLLST